MQIELCEKDSIALLWRICVCHLQYNCCDHIRASLWTNGSLQLNWAQGCLGWADQLIDCHELTFMLCSPFSIIGWSHFRSSTQTQCADDQHDPTRLIYHRDHNGRTHLSEIHQIFPHLQINHQFSSLFIPQTSCLIFVSWHWFFPIGPSFMSNSEVPLVC